VTNAEHASSDTSFRLSVLQHVGGATVVVTLVALVFWAIGTVGGPEDGLLAAADEADAGDDAPEPEPTADPEPDEPEPEPDEPEPEPDEPEPEPEPDEPESEPEADPEAEPDSDPDPEPEPEPDEPEPDEPEPEPEPDESEPDEPESEPEADPEAEPEPDPDPEPETVAPEDVTIQVLDGYQADGGTAASSLASDLTDAGYRVIARNPALRYDVTTVLWTTGNEEAGRQVAAAIGAADVRQQPGTLSDAVAVHVVVGADQG
jgi:outer membrane biosynthesis protein TonB